MKSEESTYIVEIENLDVRYAGENNSALRKVNLKVRKGEFLCIMGPTGSGKTSLALCLNGLIPNSIKANMKGKVIVKGLDTQRNKVVDFSPYVGVVFEDPDAQLFCSSVEEEVGFVLSNRELPIDEIKKRVKHTLSIVRLEGYEERVPNSLSGGEKQRVAIASVLSMRPEILVLDEPTSQLDPLGASEIFAVVRYLAKNERITVIMTEHKSEEIAEVADRVVVLNKGEIVLDGSPATIFRIPGLLDKYGIRPPQISEASTKLMSKGITLPSFPITSAEGLKIFQALIER